MTAGVVFAKTAKGVAEIDSRAAGLSARVRRVLIFVDGKRSVAALRELVQADDLTHTLGALEELGLIEVASVVEAPAVSRAGVQTSVAVPAVASSAVAAVAPPLAPQAVAAGQRLPSIYAFLGDGTEDDPRRFDMSRNFMGNTLRTFVGPVGATSLIDRIDTALDRSALRALFDEWYHAIVMSREGKRQAEDLRSKLLEII